MRETANRMLDFSLLVFPLDALHITSSVLENSTISWCHGRWGWVAFEIFARKCMVKTICAWLSQPPQIHRSWHRRGPSWHMWGSSRWGFMHGPSSRWRLTGPMHRPSSWQRSMHCHSSLWQSIGPLYHHPPCLRVLTLTPTTLCPSTGSLCMVWQSQIDGIWPFCSVLLWTCHPEQHKTKCESCTLWMAPINLHGPLNGTDSLEGCRFFRSSGLHLHEAYSLYSVNNKARMNGAVYLTA